MCLRERVDGSTQWHPWELARMHAIHEIIESVIGSNGDPDQNILFVNDGSTDGTQERLDNLCRACPERIRHIDMKRNRGKAEAVRRGFLEKLI
jgi:glycosyltransferase involved in cell wall biosynthesis